MDGIDGYGKIIGKAAESPRSSTCGFFCRPNRKRLPERRQNAVIDDSY
jgi:hypothetical protein